MRGTLDGPNPMYEIAIDLCSDRDTVILSFHALTSLPSEPCTSLFFHKHRAANEFLARHRSSRFFNRSAG
jgi:hypothetical protein